MYRKTEVIVDGLANNPKCVHGPTVLFKDTIKGKEREFYACSAYRDKKLCDFHMARDDKITAGKIFKWKECLKEFMDGKDHEACYQKMKEFKNAAGTETGQYCQSCGVFIDPQATGKHKDHPITNLKPEHLTNPLNLLQAKTGSKREAQYFFTNESSKYLEECIRCVASSHVICIGSPSIFQSLSTEFKKRLLDIDHRFLGLYSPSEFMWFNMMNFYFFHERQSDLEDFLSSATSVSIVLDPPFGARPELIAYTLNQFKSLLKDRDVSLNIFWVFPYFLEKKIQAVGHDLKMCHYRVCYTNHKEFSGSEEGRKYGSPIRIFTNVPLSKLPMPEETGYKMCNECKYFVSATDVHCEHCKSCTSKDGRPYHHCHACARCVKITYDHCLLCDRCHLKGGQCSQAGLDDDFTVETAVFTKPPAKSAVYDKVPAKSSVNSKVPGKSAVIGKNGQKFVVNGKNGQKFAINGKNGQKLADNKKHHQNFNNQKFDVKKKFQNQNSNNQKFDRKRKFDNQGWQNKKSKKMRR